jgi:hypothetical protein
MEARMKSPGIVLDVVEPIQAGLGPHMPAAWMRPH